MAQDQTWNGKSGKDVFAEAKSKNEEESNIVSLADVLPIPTVK